MTAAITIHWVTDVLVFSFVYAFLIFNFSFFYFLIVYFFLSDDVFNMEFYLSLQICKLIFNVIAIKPTFNYAMTYIWECTLTIWNLFFIFKGLATIKFICSYSKNEFSVFNILWIFTNIVLVFQNNDEL